MLHFEHITYSEHAKRRMAQRRISQPMVEFVLRVGEGEYDEMDATWTYVLDRVAIVVAERGDAAHVVTVYRVSSHT